MYTVITEVGEGCERGGLCYRTGAKLQREGQESQSHDPGPTSREKTLLTHYATLRTRHIGKVAHLRTEKGRGPPAPTRRIQPPEKVSLLSRTRIAIDEASIYGIE